MENEGRRIEVRGIVQGVGFRPWVFRLAQKHHLGGSVANDAGGVVIDVFGPSGTLDEFVSDLEHDGPPASRIDQLEWLKIDFQNRGDFSIDLSGGGDERRMSIPADLATCPDCLRELFDANDRRYRYPFINCTNCGPRYSIVTDIPYDRPGTTMARFRMCPQCQGEYDSPEDRRFHAQANACPVCGPQVEARRPNNQLVASDDPISFAARTINANFIVAVKGLGGFHLACDATNETAVVRLRERKHRYAKAFAVMVASISAAEQIADLTDDERRLLTSLERPIVLVKKREGTLAPSVAPDNPLVGLFLPYTPLHHLLLAASGRPLVMTSGNLAEEPMVTTDRDAIEKLGKIADLILTHNRDIAARVDDSVARVIDGAPMLLRRARGFVPRPLRVKQPFREPVLACGAHLKNTFAIGVGDCVYVGPYIGDLESVDVLHDYEEAIIRTKRILDVEPKIVAHDLHPDYLSTRYASWQEGVRRVGVQHHHAHIASVMAEHHLDGPVIGIAYDGTGYGIDGTAWGGEFLIADTTGFDRVATFRPIPLAGGDQAVHQVWRIALALLDDAFDGTPPLHQLALFRAIPRRGIEAVRAMIHSNINAPLAHGVGRFFDALGAIVLTRTNSRFEGDVAFAWNVIADVKEQTAYPFAVNRARTPFEIDLRPLVRAAVRDLLAGRDAALISARFHNAIADATCEVLAGIVESVGDRPIVLSGGVFQNSLLTERILERSGLRSRIFLNREVPPGDGGISLGQAVIACASAYQEK